MAEMARLVQTGNALTGMKSSDLDQGVYRSLERFAPGMASSSDWSIFLFSDHHLRPPSSSPISSAVFLLSSSPSPFYASPIHHHRDSSLKAASPPHSPSKLSSSSPPRSRLHLSLLRPASWFSPLRRRKSPLSPPFAKLAPPSPLVNPPEPNQAPASSITHPPLLCSVQPSRHRLFFSATLLLPSQIASLSSSLLQSRPTRFIVLLCTKLHVAGLLSTGPEIATAGSSAQTLISDPIQRSDPAEIRPEPAL